MEGGGRDKAAQICAGQGDVRAPLLLSTPPCTRLVRRKVAQTYCELFLETSGRPRGNDGATGRQAEAGSGCRHPARLHYRFAPLRGASGRNHPRGERAAARLARRARAAIACSHRGSLRARVPRSSLPDRRLGSVPQDPAKCRFSEWVPSSANTAAGAHVTPLPARLPSRPQGARARCMIHALQTVEPGTGNLAGEQYLGSVDTRDACIALVESRSDVCLEPKIASMPKTLSAVVSNNVCYCVSGTDYTSGLSALQRPPPSSCLRWPCCLLCACALASVPRLILMLFRRRSRRARPPCVQILHHRLSAASSPSREAPRLRRLIRFLAISAKRVPAIPIARTVRRESTNP